ncbi:MAG TPA: PilZ domain-containing protein [Kofleriaceae bacterium]|nr:PilZ domain-containing protein [Kofleriaceae bacterium]
MDRETVVIELADDPAFARDLSAGGVFVRGCTLRINADCTLVVRGPLEEIELAARVVYVDASLGGAGLELVGFSPALREHLTRLMTAWSPGASAMPPPRVASARALDEGGESAANEPLDLGFDFADLGIDEDDSGAAEGLDSEDDGAARESRNEVAAPSSSAPAGDDAATRGGAAKRAFALNLHQRLRGLTLAQQIKVARSGLPQVRIVLERLYNKNVWEALLRNPRLTPPEVSRIARMGTLPRVSLEVIVGNGAWLQIPEIRRALLSNPRLGTDQILRVLRMLPKHELKLAATQTAYPYAVRDAAKRMLKELGVS